MTSTPSTPISSRPGITPASTLFVRSAVLLMVLSPMTTAMTAPPAAVIARAHQVERSVRSLIHSIRATCRNR